MAHILPVSHDSHNEGTSTEQQPQRNEQIRLGVAIEVAAIVWMVIEASVALISGYASRSVSLESFGIDSIIELIAGGILLWRLLEELHGRSSERVEQAERIAAWVTATALFVLALYIVVNSGLTFLHGERPEATWWGTGLAIAAAIIMPLLWQGKLRIARRIGSGALRADAACSLTCGYMSLTLLIGLALNGIFGWWWADPLAALALVYFIVSEGLEALEEARTGEDGDEQD